MESLASAGVSTSSMSEAVQERSMVIPLFGIVCMTLESLAAAS
jgi:hypothetical protein